MSSRRVQLKKNVSEHEPIHQGTQLFTQLTVQQFFTQSASGAIEKLARFLGWKINLSSNNSKRIPPLYHLCECITPKLAFPRNNDGKRVWALVVRCGVNMYQVS